MSDCWKGFFYGQAFAVPVYIVTWLVTGSPLPALPAAVITAWLANKDWDAKRGPSR